MLAKKYFTALTVKAIQITVIFKIVIDVTCSCVSRKQLFQFNFICIEAIFGS